MNAQEIRIGSRGSPLALAQARLVAEALAGQGRRSRIVIVETEGDRRAPDTAWGEGAFVAAIERALLSGAVDIAVHSAKDIPTEEDPRLCLGAYLPRADPRDALVVAADATARLLDDLPPGSRVGTDSPRRTGFLLARRPDLLVHPLHGNVDTRLRRLDTGETDALVLACAGLDRMGLGDRIAERLDPDVVPPAPGQGAIALQVRRDDARTLAITTAIDDADTRVTVEAEREFLRASGGGCRAPIGALATLARDEIRILAGYTGPDGSGAAFARRRGPRSARAELARELTAELGTRDRIGASRPIAPTQATGPRRPRVLVTRAVDQVDELLSALSAAGLDPVQVPAIAIELDPPDGDLDAAARILGTYAWVVITSANGARAILGAAERIGTDLRVPSWAAIGPVTRRVLEAAGIAVDLQPSRSERTALALELPVTPGDRVLVVRGDHADEGLPAALRARGAEVDDVIAYRTREAPEASRSLLRDARADGPIDAVVFTSGSTVRGLVTIARAEGLDVASIPSVSIGPATAAAARDAGFSVLAISPAPEADALAATTARALLAHSKETR